MDLYLSSLQATDIYLWLFKDITRKAKILGASYIVVAMIPHKQNQFGIEDAKKAVKDFNQVGKVLSKQGLILCYHSHGYEFTPYGKGTLFDYMVQYTNPRYVVNFPISETLLN